jgi:hypothetical protein
MQIGGMMVVRTKKGFKDRQRDELKKTSTLRWHISKNHVAAFLVGLVLSAGGFLLFSTQFNKPKNSVFISGSLKPFDNSLEGDPYGHVRSLYQLMSLSERELENLDIDSSLALINDWAEKVKAVTEGRLHAFYKNPDKYDNSEAVFRAVNLVLTLKNDLGIHYNEEAAKHWDFSDSTVIFIHGLLGDKHSGTCTSIPVLCVAIGRRLGYPLKLVHAKQHTFFRWDDDKKRFNIEACCIGVDIRDDEYYKKCPHEIHESDFYRGHLLKSLTAAEELDFFMLNRGNSLRDMDRLTEAQVAYAVACRLLPDDPIYLMTLLSLVDHQLDMVAVKASKATGQPGDYAMPINFKGKESYFVWQQHTDRPPEQKSPEMSQSTRRPQIDVDELARRAERASEARRQKIKGSFLPEIQSLVPGQPKEDQ